MRWGPVLRAACLSSSRAAPADTASSHGAATLSAPSSAGRAATRSLRLGRFAFSVPAEVTAALEEAWPDDILFRYASSAIPTARAAEALIARGPATLKLDIAYAPGFERQVTEGVAELARAYTVADHAHAGDLATPAFHLPTGAIALPFRTDEALTASLDARRLGFDAISVSTDTQVEAGDAGPGLIADWRDRVRNPLTHARGVTAELLRADLRVVAGMDGEEIVARGAGKGESPAMAFEWRYRGENAHPTRPHFRISASARGGDPCAAVHLGRTPEQRPPAPGPVSARPKRVRVHVPRSRAGDPARIR